MYVDFFGDSCCVSERPLDDDEKEGHILSVEVATNKPDEELAWAALIAIHNLSLQDGMNNDSRSVLEKLLQKAFEAGRTCEKEAKA